MVIMLMEELINNNIILREPEKKECIKYINDLFFHFSTNFIRLPELFREFFSKEKINNKNKEEIIQLCSRIILEIIINNNRFDIYKSLIEYGINIKILNDKYKDKLQIFLNQKAIEEVKRDVINNDNIQFLLNQGVNKVVFFDVIMDNDDFVSFKYLIKEYNINKKTNKKILKISIEKDKFQFFKYLIDEYSVDLEEIKEEQEWGEKIQLFLDRNLEKECSKFKERFPFNKNKAIYIESDMRFLLSQGANEKIVLNMAINKNQLEWFRFLIEHLYINLEEIKEEQEWGEKIQLFLDGNLEKECSRFKERFSFNKNKASDIRFLLSQGANEKIVLNMAISKNQLEWFRFLIEHLYINLEEIKEEQEWGEKIQSFLDKNLDYFIHLIDEAELFNKFNRIDNENYKEFQCQFEKSKHLNSNYINHMYNLGKKQTPYTKFYTISTTYSTYPDPVEPTIYTSTEDRRQEIVGNIKEALQYFNECLNTIKLYNKL